MSAGRKETIIAGVAGIVPVTWLALKLAPYCEEGLFAAFARLDEILDKPFSITLCPGSLRMILILNLIYIMGIGIYISMQKNYRRGEEHGSARWGDASQVNRKYEAKPASENKLLTQNVRIGLDGRKHRRNLNVLVIGGSGAGKTRFYCKPNLMQANTSFVILDPKGEQVRAVGNLLREKDYEVKVLDLINMEKSHCYNPFVYLRDDNDVQRLVTNLFKSTTPKGAQSSEPFWDNAAQMLLLALIFYLKYEAPDDEQNFAMVMEMLRAGDVDEDNNMPSPLDNLFYDLEKTDPNHIALKYYRSYHSGAAKTLKSIQITLRHGLRSSILKVFHRLLLQMSLNSIHWEKRKLQYSPLYLTTTPALTFWCRFCIPSFFSSSLKLQTRSMAAACLYTFTSSWTSLRTSHFLTTLTRYFRL